MITRDEAVKLLKKHVHKKEILQHSFACEAVMRAIAQHFNAAIVPIPLSEEEWGIVGLLHDLDYEETKNTPELHTSILEKEVKDLVDPEMLYAMRSHNWQFNGIAPKALMDWSIACCDELTGFIMACAQAHTSKNIHDMSPLFILNRFNDKAFAAGADREKIQLCEWRLEIALPQFIEIALIAMQGISQQLGFAKKKNST